LRYSVEFVGSFYPGKAVKRFLKPLKKLQQSLGVINDSATAVRFAERLAQEGRLDLAMAVARLAHVWERDAAAARRGLDEQWSAFKGEERFWR
jgi:triphosphatase